MARFLKRYMALSCRCRAVAHPYREDRPAPQRHRIEDSARRVRMPVSYTNRKGVTYTLYRGQTKTGKPRYYFGRAGQSQGESARSGCATWGVSTAGWSWGERDPWRSWPMRSFPPWAQISSMNSGEPTTDAGATKHRTEGPF